MEKQHGYKICYNTEEWTVTSIKDECYSRRNIIINGSMKNMSTKEDMKEVIKKNLPGPYLQKEPRMAIWWIIYRGHLQNPIETFDCISYLKLGTFRETLNEVILSDGLEEEDVDGKETAERRAFTSTVAETSKLKKGNHTLADRISEKGRYAKLRKLQKTDHNDWLHIRMRLRTGPSELIHQSTSLHLDMDSVSSTNISLLRYQPVVKRTGSKETIPCARWNRTLALAYLMEVRTKVSHQRQKSVYSLYNDHSPLFHLHTNTNKIRLEKGILGTFASFSDSFTVDNKYLLYCLSSETVSTKEIADDLMEAVCICSVMIITAAYTHSKWTNVGSCLNVDHRETQGDTGILLQYFSLIKQWGSKITPSRFWVNHTHHVNSDAQHGTTTPFGSLDQVNTLSKYVFYLVKERKISIQSDHVGDPFKMLGLEKDNSKVTVLLPEICATGHSNLIIHGSRFNNRGHAGQHAEAG
ncbi:hypothetical protein GQR58_023804 [Nymphon striatum]|nr:hypothetical protein GQR58_023804 [Nymphon striatum]